MYLSLGYPQMPKGIKLCGAERCLNNHFLMGPCEYHYIEWEANLKRHNLLNQIKKNKEQLSLL
jgi:hypothetical protein